MINIYLDRGCALYFKSNTIMYLFPLITLENDILDFKPLVQCILAFTFTSSFHIFKIIIDTTPIKTLYSRHHTY